MQRNHSFLPRSVAAFLVAAIGIALHVRAHAQNTGGLQQRASATADPTVPWFGRAERGGLPVVFGSAGLATRLALPSCHSPEGGRCALRYALWFPREKIVRPRLSRIATVELRL